MDVCNISINNMEECTGILQWEVSKVYLVLYTEYRKNTYEKRRQAIDYNKKHFV